MGIRPSNTCELILQDVVIPEANRVGREGEGFRIAMNTLDSARPFVGVSIRWSGSGCFRLCCKIC